ncbi:MAG: SPASM domain-containing protein, partial [archaeon]|nr:SPASM domain-containing protein [archaeon]
DLKMYPCCIFKNNPKYCLGDLSKQSFKKIWKSDARKNVSERINLKQCPNPCMYHQDAELLSAVKEPIKHYNFL